MITVIKRTIKCISQCLNCFDSPIHITNSADTYWRVHIYHLPTETNINTTNLYIPVGSVSK